MSLVNSFFQKIFKQHFYVVHLCGVALAAILIAKMTGTLAVDRLVQKWVKPEDKELLASKNHIKNTTKSSSTRNLNQALSINIFSAIREDIADESTPTVAFDPTSVDWSTAVKTSLKWILLGTAVFQQEEDSLASIRDEGKKSTTVHTINPCIENVQEVELLPIRPEPCATISERIFLKRIEPERVYFWNEGEGRLEYLSLEDEATPSTKDKEPVKTAEVATDNNIRKLSDTKYEVNQSEVDKALGDFASLSTMARVVPSFEGGKNVGFKIFAIKQGSLFSKIGLQNGDILTRVNGYEINGPDKALDVYQKLKESKTVSLEVKRNKTPVTLDYTITSQ